MAKQLTLKEAFQEAIKDYNTWAASKSKGYDAANSYGELRGIFFNKLITQLREVEGFQVKHRAYYGRSIIPEDLYCQFGSLCGLESAIVSPPSHSGVGDARVTLLLGLSEAAKEAVYDVLQSQIEYDLAGIVNRIKAYKV